MNYSSQVLPMNYKGWNEQQRFVVVWLLEGFEKNDRTPRKWNQVLDYSTRRTYWKSWLECLKIAVENKSVKDEMVLAYANGIYKKRHPNCPSASFKSKAQKKSERKGKTFDWNTGKARAL